MAESFEKKWYVLHTYAGYENKVKTNLESRAQSMGMEDYIFRVVVPEEEKVETTGIRDKLVTGVQTCALPILQQTFLQPKNVRIHGR
ncbi:transcription termination/antitermination factor NusG, nusG [Pediococcus acidilactici D3]|nr:transcription termination/antitermination factor NusG, nusG [Pediococcus acidilactici D3]